MDWRRLLPNIALLGSFTLGTIAPALALPPPNTDRLGKFSLIYEPSDNKLHRALQDGLRKSGLFAKLIDDLNQSNLVLRTDIPVIIRDCGTANAFYNPRDNSVTICNELFLQIAGDLENVTSENLQDSLTDALYVSIFAFYHELGHALIDVLSLPTVGNEEDAADQFAALILINSGDQEIAQKTIVNAATWFATSPEVPAWEQHVPNDKRFYNLVCMVYGSDPREYQSLGRKIPKERADLCPQEFAKINNSWNQLLLPHFLEANRPWSGRAERRSTRNPPAGRIW
ncbi:MAG: hypothetical protein N5P05_001688 [Chroococcopsis gigantea SAG 12.99]|jgi:hypothetical protein|nr:hypothetical protein [Chlorogloea purpurea SAG 13.99]MDV3000082.1 hypothetical protein [Chroococcopsis gigantea SAG 12.99]